MSLLRKTIMFMMVALSGLVLYPAAVRAEHVRLELALLIDVSGSVDANEYNLQLGGYVDAFNNGTIQGLIESTPGGIAVNFVQWSGAAQQQMSVGWTILRTAQDCVDFATTLSGVDRAFTGNTAPGSAINFAVNGADNIFNNGIDSDRQVIDVSGDGAANNGDNTQTARDNALAAGIDAINGLVILGETGVQTFYQNNIVGGTNAFLVTANSFDDFSNAIQTKLLQEIQEVPVPAGVLMAGIGILCVAGYRRFSRKPLSV